MGSARALEEREKYKKHSFSKNRTWIRKISEQLEFPIEGGLGRGPYGPLWAHMGTILLKKLLILMKNNEIVNKNIKGVKSEKIKIKTWFCDKDLSSLDSIN